MVEGIEGALPDNRFEVMVCTGDLVFTGIFKYGFEQRLIDALNEGVRLNPQVKIVDFIILQDATMTGAGNVEKKYPQIYIAKHNIIFMAQVTSKKRTKPMTTYPFRPKTSIGVTIFAAQIYVAQANAKPYELKGEIYVDSWGQIVDTLETGVQFIPLTDVEIKQAPPHVGNRFEFLAINKQRIISICENPKEQ
jgi:hypothetical protein